MGLGETLRHLRRTSPLGRTSVDRAAADLGIPRATIYLWESPRSRGEPRDLRRYCEYLGATEEQIREVLELRSLPADEVDGAREGAA